MEKEMNRLMSRDQIKSYILANDGSGNRQDAVNFARQLYDVMGDNEQMRKALIKLTAYEGWTKQIALEGLGQSNKDTDMKPRHKYENGLCIKCGCDYLEARKNKCHPTKTSEA